MDFLNWKVNKMGKISQTCFGTSDLPKAIVLAGHQEETFREVFVDLDVEFSCELTGFSGYLFSDPRLAVIKDVYGASSTYDAVKTLEDGDCQSMVFVGWAQSRAEHDIGDVVVPTKIKGLDSISRGEEIKPKVSEGSLPIRPDDFGGRHLSKPAITYESRELEREIENFEPQTIDLELATIAKISENLGIECQFYQVISDNAFEDLFDEEKKERRNKSMIDLLTGIKAHFQ